MKEREDGRQGVGAEWQWYVGLVRSTALSGVVLSQWKDAVYSATVEEYNGFELHTLPTQPHYPTSNHSTCMHLHLHSVQSYEAAPPSQHLHFPSPLVLPVQCQKCHSRQYSHHTHRPTQPSQPSRIIRYRTAHSTGTYDISALFPLALSPRSSHPLCVY